MFIYWGKRVEADHVGQRQIRVECKQCGCEYFYMLTRIGTGIRNAPYGVGVGIATRSAKKEAQKDIARKLDLEAELVPCPSCNWINDELVRGYQRGRYRGLGVAAVGVAVVGTISSLIASWYISIGPMRDRAALPYCLIGGPILFIVLAMGIILLQRWMRSRIQPNSNFPLPPRLPPGTPPALLKDTATEHLKVAQIDDALSIGPSDWQDFQIGRHHLPLQCCDCLQSVPEARGYECAFSPLMKLIVPRCEECLHAAKRKSRIAALSMAVVGLLLTAGLMALMNRSSVEVWLIGGSLAVISLAFAAFVGSTITKPVRMKLVDRSRGVMRLRFSNPEYARIVAGDLSIQNAG